MDTTGFHINTSKKINQTKKRYYCKDCGVEISSGAERCVFCAKENRRIVIRPSREELKEKIRKYSFVSLGKEYGVSDKAISKWCIAYNLPSRKKDIVKYTDENWELL